MVCNLTCYTFILVMCSLERIHDSDPTPAIVSTITTPAKWEPLVPPAAGVLVGVVVVWVGVARSRLESPGVGVI